MANEQKIENILKRWDYASTLRGVDGIAFVDGFRTVLSEFAPGDITAAAERYLQGSHNMHDVGMVFGVLEHLNRWDMIEAYAQDARAVVRDTAARHLRNRR